MSYEVKLEQFEGPLDVLLSLIQQHKLEITEISLAKVADQFVAIMQSTEISPREMVDFLVIATKLLLMKSRALLPHLVDEEEEAEDLTSHLRIYKEFADAALELQEMYNAGHYGFFRKVKTTFDPEFSPPQTLQTNDLADAMVDILKRIRPLYVVEASVMDKQVSLSERIDYLQNILETQSRTSFSALRKFTNSKTELVVTFLAMLELLKQGDIHVEQSDPFSDIMIKKQENRAEESDS